DRARVVRRREIERDVRRIVAAAVGEQATRRSTLLVERFDEVMARLIARRLAGDRNIALAAPVSRPRGIVEDDAIVRDGAHEILIEIERFVLAAEPLRSALL